MGTASPSPLLPTFARIGLSFERGEGPWLITPSGERYLDFAAGIAVNSLGHAHPHLVKALQDQAAKLWHVSNLYEIPEGGRLAQRLVENTFADTVFFTNSGAEALECAIKMARKLEPLDLKWIEEPVWPPEDHRGLAKVQDVGGIGQEKLLKSKVLVIGAGGLGSPAILYLAAAGVGTIGVVTSKREVYGSLTTPDPVALHRTLDELAAHLEGCLDLELILSLAREL